jgi:hypothetical protein
MCGRARLSSDVSEIKIAFGIPPERPTPNIPPSWNLAPTDPAPVVYYDARDAGRRLEVMRWGLIPYWAKDIKISFSTINARAEAAGRLLTATPLPLKGQKITLQTHRYMQCRGFRREWNSFRRIPRAPLSHPR